MVNYEYQVGGSLKPYSPTYVVRQADLELFQALIAGQLCYVFNSRQMGKSSLRVQVQQTLRDRGMRCTSLDMSRIGSTQITPSQWYKGILIDLLRGFNLLDRVNFTHWWSLQQEIPPLQRLSLFFEDLLFKYFPDDRIYILIDEIDSALELSFPVDDFFAFLRYSYDQRAENPHYRRLTWALFGVATPSDLIRAAPHRHQARITPFNIGQAIELRGFQDHEVEPLLPGLAEHIAHSRAVMRAILTWTNGQPFLTQKLCQKVVNLAQATPQGFLDLPVSAADFWVESVVRSHVLNHWESQDHPEHLRTIRDRLLCNEVRSGRLLGLYQQILQPDPSVSDMHPDAAELLLSGLVERYGGQLQVKNPIYRAVFSPQWVNEQLLSLRPYAVAIVGWLRSHDQDTSWVLRGEALKHAQSWAEGKSLSDQDYQFLSASQQVDRQEVQRQLETARLQEVQARVEEQQRHLHRQRQLLGGLGALWLIICGLGIGHWFRYQELRTSEQRARLSEIHAITASSEALLASRQGLDALLSALQAWAKVRATSAPPQIATPAERVLRQAVDQAIAQNRLVGHQSRVWDVAWSPDGQVIASVSGDKTLKLWRSDGSAVSTYPAHTGPIWGVAFSPDGQTIATASWDKTVKLWSRDGSLRQTLTGHTAAVWRVAFSPDGQTIASVSDDKTIRLWTIAGRLLTTLKGHTDTVWDVAFSPDGRTLVSASADRTVKLWTRQGQVVQTLRGHRDRVAGVAFSPDGATIASASDDQTVKLWNPAGRVLKTLTGHTAAVWDVAFSPDGATIASASWDRTLRVWNRDGQLLHTLQGHRDRVRRLSFSPDGTTIASASEDQTLYLWRLQHPARQILTGHQANVLSVAIHPDGRSLVTSSDDRTLKRWNFDGTVSQTFSPSHQAGVLATAISPKGDWIASASWDQTIKLWNSQGRLQRTFQGHQGPVWDVKFHPSLPLLVSASRDRTLKLWQLDGTVLKTLSGHEGEVRSVAIHPTYGSFASASLDGSIYLWDSQGILVRAIAAHPKGATSVQFDPKGQVLVSGGFDGTVRLWSPEGKPLKTLNATSPVLRVAISPDSQHVAAATTEGTILVWTMKGDRLGQLYGPAAAWGLAFHPTRPVLVSTHENGTAIVWQLDRTLALEAVLQMGCDWVSAFLRQPQPLYADVQAVCQTSRSPSGK